MSLQTKTGLFSMEAFHTKTPVSTMAAGFCGCSCGCGCSCLTCCDYKWYEVDPLDPSVVITHCEGANWCSAGCAGTCAGL